MNFSVMEFRDLRWVIVSKGLTEQEAKDRVAQATGNNIPAAYRPDDEALAAEADSAARSGNGDRIGGQPDYRDPAVHPGSYVDPGQSLKFPPNPDVQNTPTPDRPTTSEAG